MIYHTWGHGKPTRGGSITTLYYNERLGYIMRIRISMRVCQKSNSELCNFQSISRVPSNSKGKAIS